jgi:hypothetical protein
MNRVRPPNLPGLVTGVPVSWPNDQAPRRQLPHVASPMKAPQRRRAQRSSRRQRLHSVARSVLVMSGDLALDGVLLAERMLYYLGTTRSEASFSSDVGARVLLIGGPPFAQTILMWWNFAARTPEEIAQARSDWEERRRFGEVVAYDGPRLSAPALTRFARPNPVS